VVDFPSMFFMFATGNVIECQYILIRGGWNVHALVVNILECMFHNFLSLGPVTLSFAGGYMICL